jgi:hypothetical protein
VVVVGLIADPFVASVLLFAIVLLEEGAGVPLPFMLSGLSVPVPPCFFTFGVLSVPPPSSLLAGSGGSVLSSGVVVGVVLVGVAVVVVVVVTTVVTVVVVMVVLVVVTLVVDAHLVGHGKSGTCNISMQ